MGDGIVEPMTRVAAGFGPAAILRPAAAAVSPAPAAAASPIAFEPADRTAPPTRDEDAAWRARAESLGAFVETAGRLPTDASGAPASERALAQWLRRQRELARAGRLGEPRTRRLDALAVGWLDPRELEWRANAVAVGLHLAHTGGYPSAGADDLDERRLANWLRTQRRAERASRLAPGRLAWLDLNLPSWRRPSDETWSASAGLLEDFCADHRRLPVDTAPADDLERRLARWLRRQREAASEDRLDDDCRRRLDAIAPGWFDPVGARWTRMARATAAWTGRRGAPSKHAADPAERRLGEWLAAQRRAAASGALRPERADWLDRSMPSWRRIPDGAWRSRLDELRRFVAGRGRLPQRSAAAGDVERRIAGWLADQRGAARARGLAD
ncbi:helicase associated domain-containing protein [Agromyces soli]